MPLREREQRIFKVLFSAASIRFIALLVLFELIAAPAATHLRPPVATPLIQVASMLLLVLMVIELLSASQSATTSHSPSPGA
jgi:hypothetical protein